MTFKPETPYVTADVIIETEGGIVLVQRRHPPLGWALPGGFVERGETVAQAARREAKEETGLDVELTALLGLYSDPKRDPRGLHTAGAVFVGRASGVPRGGDDATAAQVFALDALPDDIPFDHPTIIADYLRFLLTGQRAPLDR
jgi:8-oxo-dGTP diphosphatase